jgi:ribose transport system permease protein
VSKTPVAETQSPQDTEGPSERHRPLFRGVWKPLTRYRPAVAVVNRYALLLGWFGVIVLFSILKPSTFLSSANFITILSSQGVLVVLTLGLLMPLIAGELDLSIGGTLGLSSVVVTVLNVQHQIPWGLAVAGGLIVGPLVGIINGFFVVTMGVDALVVTLGTGTFVAGIGFAVSNYTTITGVSPTLVNLMSNNLFGLPYSFYYGILLAFVVWYVMRFTPLGRHLIFVGQGREVARLSGLNVRGLRFGAFVTCGLISAAAGVVLTGTLGGADPSAGASYLLPAFAAAFLGSTTITPGLFNAWGAIVAVYFLVTGVAGLQLLGLADWIQQVFYGLTLVLAVTLSQVVARRTDRA